MFLKIETTAIFFRFHIFDIVHFNEGSGKCTALRRYDELYYSGAGLGAWPVRFTRVTGDILQIGSETALLEGYVSNSRTA